MTAPLFGGWPLASGQSFGSLRRCGRVDLPRMWGRLSSSWVFPNGQVGWWKHRETTFNSWVSRGNKKVNNTKVDQQPIRSWNDGSGCSRLDLRLRCEINRTLVNGGELHVYTRQYKRETEWRLSVRICSSLRRTRLVTIEWRAFQSEGGGLRCDLKGRLESG